MSLHRCPQWLSGCLRAVGNQRPDQPARSAVQSSSSIGRARYRRQYRGYASEAAGEATYGQPRYDISGSTLVLACIPILTFGLGTWQVRRLQWKQSLIKELDEKLAKPPMLIPVHLDPAAVPEFAYRKVEVSGRFDHSREVLLGPRTREGVLGYSVITPFVRVDGDPASAILVNRGHVSLTRMKQADRPESLINESQEIVGMLRSQEKRNMFSPANRPEIGEYQFMDIEQMASAMGTQPVLVDQIFEGNAGQMKSMISHGVPLGRAPTIELRNMHATYAITWYSLSFATTIMLWRLMRKPIKHNRFIRHQ